MTAYNVPLVLLNMQQCLPQILATDAPNTHELREPQQVLLNDLVPFKMSPEVTIPVKRDGSLLHNANDYQNLHRRIRWKYNQVLAIFEEIHSLAEALKQEIVGQLDPSRIILLPVPVGANY